jgi:hypothetical protein
MCVECIARKVSVLGINHDANTTKFDIVPRNPTAWPRWMQHRPRGDGFIIYSATSAVGSLVANSVRFSKHHMHNTSRKLVIDLKGHFLLGNAHRSWLLLLYRVRSDRKHRYHL